ncbi:MAG: phosphotransferase [Chloroflexota bacterium]|nr:phosphotransferase [Chloroflexota bacterium]MDE2898509.1 phosphotransferase [Chloroflexota bacterium]
MSSSPSVETGARIRAVLAAADQPSDGRLRRVRQGLWRWTAGNADLALKLFNGPNAHERLRTEAALYRKLGPAGAPVPALVVEEADKRALARDWIPGSTVFQRLLASDTPNASEAETVRRAWLRLLQALAPWNTRISESRRQKAMGKRQVELAAVAHGVAQALPSVPSDAVDDLRHTIASDELLVLPLDASPSNIIVNPETVTFIDLELLGLDFADWTYAKYVTAVGETGAVLSLADRDADESASDGLDAALTLLALARAAGLWGESRNLPTDLANHIPGRSRAARRIRAGLRLESSVTSDCG